MNSALQARIETNINFCLSLVEREWIFWVLFLLGFIVFPSLYIFFRKQKASWDAAILAPVFISMVFYQPVFSFMCRIESLSYKDMNAKSFPALPQNQAEPLKVTSAAFEPKKENESCKSLVRNADFAEGFLYWDGSFLERTRNFPRGFWSAAWQSDSESPGSLTSLVSALPEQIEGAPALKVVNKMPEIRPHNYGTMAQQVSIPSDLNGQELVFVVNYKTDETYKDNAASFAFSDDWNERFNLPKTTAWKWAYKELGKRSGTLPVRFISENLGTVFLRAVRIVPKSCIKTPL